MIKRCNCKKNKCLKLYCVCFSAGTEGPCCLVVRVCVGGGM